MGCHSGMWERSYEAYLVRDPSRYTLFLSETCTYDAGALSSEESLYFSRHRGVLCFKEIGFLSVKTNVIT